MEEVWRTVEKQQTTSKIQITSVRFHCTVKNRLLPGIRKTHGEIPEELAAITDPIEYNYLLVRLRKEFNEKHKSNYHKNLQKNSNV